jgi:hypothetical protein
MNVIKTALKISFCCRILLEFAFTFSEIKYLLAKYSSNGNAKSLPRNTYRWYIHVTIAERYMLQKETV